VKAYSRRESGRKGAAGGIDPQFYPEPEEKFSIADEESILFRKNMTKIAKEIIAPCPNSISRERPPAPDGAAGGLFTFSQSFVS